MLLTLQKYDQQSQMSLIKMQGHEKGQAYQSMVKVANISQIDK